MYKAASPGDFRFRSSTNGHGYNRALVRLQGERRGRGKTPVDQWEKSGWSCSCPDRMEIEKRAELPTGGEVVRAFVMGRSCDGGMRSCMEEQLRA